MDRTCTRDAIRSQGNMFALILFLISIYIYIYIVSSVSSRHYRQPKYKTQSQVSAMPTGPSHCKAKDWPRKARTMRDASNIRKNQNPSQLGVLTSNHDDYVHGSSFSCICWISDLEFSQELRMRARKAFITRRAASVSVRVIRLARMFAAHANLHT